MQGIHKNRQNSEVKRKELLAKLVLIRTEAEKIGAEADVLKDIDELEQAIKSARVNIRKYRDFLQEENAKLKATKEFLSAIKENKRKDAISQIKGSILILFLPAIPNIFLSKFYYLSQMPKHIPESSTFIYIMVGDVLFYSWIFIYIFYALAFLYIRKNYITPFIENNPPLNIPMKLCSVSMFFCIYTIFLYYSASIIFGLISPSWGPSTANVFNLIIALLTSSPIGAVVVLISIWPVVGILIKKYKKYVLFHFRKISS